MHLNSILLALPAIVGHFQYVRASNSCFAANSNDRAANFQTCCSAQSSGTAYIGNAKYSFMCDAAGEKNRRGPFAAGNALACAQKCHEEPSCVSSTWLSEQGHCYWSDTPGKGRKDGDTLKYMWLVKSGTDDSNPDPDPEPDCQKQIAAAALKEKKACRVSLDELETKHSAALKIREGRIEELEEQLREGMTQPKRRWELLAGNLKHDEEATSAGRAEYTFGDHKKDVNSVAFSPDGLRFASGSADTTVRLWDLSTKVSQELQGHNSDVLSVAFSSDGKYLASGSKDRTIRIWDGKTGAFIRSLEGHSGQVRAVAFPQHGFSNLLASGSNDKLVKLQLASTSYDKHIRFLSLTQGDDIDFHQGVVNSNAVAFSPKGTNHFASAFTDGTVKVWKSI
ncbi:WD40-repeat-containing domain protein [Aspergillus arachidicola]|uniref:WD40-repeat-containing domain protein n=1 Tax=Aspergillus arachidicola TaxID=656916 RepID=A0A5N6XMQ1_9EURO|nr:WD40-repeat-containing domain protein [Aspergillus arachidicola]